MGRELILIVDDEPMIRQQAEVALRSLGYRTIIAGNGSEALETVEKVRPDVLLTDIRMPDMDGMELFTSVRKLIPEIIGIFMTAYGSIDNVVKSMQLGISGFLLKPFTARELERALTDVIERTRQVRETARLQLLTPLFQIRRLLVEELDLAKACRSLVKALALEAGSDYCSIFLCETPDSKKLELLASYVGAAAENFSPRVFPALHVASRAVEARRTMSLRRAANTDQLPEGELIPGAVLSVPLLIGGKIYGVLLVGRADAHLLFTSGEREMFEVIAFQLATLLYNQQNRLELEAERDQASRLAARFSAAEDDYKRQLAEQIQTNLIPVLGSTRKNIQDYLQKTRPSYAADLLGVEERLRGLVNTAKRFSNQLYPTELAEFGLSATLRDYIRDLQENPKFKDKVSFKLEGEETPRLERNVELNLFRAVQDGLEFVGPPNYRAEVLVSLTGPRNRPDKLEISLSSNHPGFEGEQDLRTLTFKERVRAAGATCEIKSASADSSTRLLIHYKVVWELPPV